MRNLILALLLIAGAAPLEAQSLRYLRRTGGFGSIGLGAGNVQIECGGPCTLGRSGTSAGELTLGRNFGPRVRLELGVVYQGSREDVSTQLRGFTAGLGFHPIAGLRVSGGAAFLTADGAEPGIDYSTAKGTGFVVGASYDIPLFRMLTRSWALMPFVSYTRASMRNITNTTTATTLTGTATAMRYGIALHIGAARWECTPRGGAPVRLTSSTRTRFIGCLNELGRQVGPNDRIKL